MRGIFLVVLALLLVLPQTTDGQVTSVMLNYPQWNTEENRELVIDVITPFREGGQTIDYRVVGETAEAGKDFVATSGTLVFQANEFRKQFTIQLLDDSLFEGNEHFIIELSNPVPAAPFTATHFVSIRDDEEGYAPEFGRTEWESAGYIDVTIFRKGDIDFASSVEVVLEEETAKAGIDYVDGSYTLEFGPGQTAKSIRVPLINNTVEDPHSSVFLSRGDRVFYVSLRNATGVPIALPSRADVIIRDNELGYVLRGAAGSTHPELYEGGPEPLVLERIGDYEISSAATVRVTAAPDHYLFPPATPGVDFNGSQFEVQFAPGQKTAEVPLEIIDELVAESREWLKIEYPTNVTIAGSIEKELSIVDNEFNPLPVTSFCLGLQPLVISVVPLSDGKFLVSAADDDSARNLSIRRFNATGEPDPAFATILPEDPPIKIVEGADGKYTVSFSNWRTGKQGVERYLSGGRPDPTFQRFVENYVTGFGEIEVTSEGEVYLGYPLRRLKNDGTPDASFAPPGLQTLDDLLLDSAENIYLRSGNGWVRLNPSGVVDASFEVPSSDILREVGGVLYVYRYDSQESIARTWRVLTSGAADPGFTPITNGWIYAGAGGKLYGFEQAGSETHVRRYHSDGTVDAAYTRGTLNADWPVSGYSMLHDGRGFMTRNAMGVQQLNGARMYCPDGSMAVARVDLDIPLHRTLVEPGRTELIEGSMSASKFIPVIRTGENASPGSVRYRIRAGTGVAGAHYVAAAEGELVFEAGQSRVQIPFEVVDNSKPEIDRMVFVDLLDETRTVLSTSEVVIRNEDVGFEVLGLENGVLRLRAVAGEFAGIQIFQSSDLLTWEFAPKSFAFDGEIFEIELSGSAAFLRPRGFF